MGEIPKTKRYTAHLVLWVGIFLAVPLWREFREPARQGWNIFLAAFLLALVAGAFLGIRRLQKGHIEVGEARFGQRDLPPTSAFHHHQTFAAGSAPMSAVAQ